MKKVISSIFGLIFVISSSAIAQEHREFFLRNIAEDIIRVIHKDILV